MGRLTAGVVLGIGLGGFADGIVLHQMAQWHNMGSAVLRPTTMEAMSRNMAWDGLFSLVTWIITLVGVFMLWSEAQSNTQSNTQPDSVGVFSGELLLGWGGFNLVEGLIDHHLLKLHHVRDLPAHVPVYDWVFLLVGGIGFLLIGWSLRQPIRRRVGAEPW